MTLMPVCCSVSINRGVVGDSTHFSEMATMSNIYLTLVSDVTSDYASNVANQFEVKLGLRLSGTRWKVSIASAILPKMALFKDL